MAKPLKVYILAYPDNPISSIFLDVFLKYNIQVKGIVVEVKKGKKNRQRFKKKIHKDGVLRAVSRALQVFMMKIRKNTVVDLARKHHIEVHKVAKFNSKACEELLYQLDIDLFAIASAPILKEYVFNKAKKGCLNAHPGWLPKYRGLGANAHALENGNLPGITVHYIDAGIDTGKIILREKMPISSNDSVAKINDRAVARGAELMANVIKHIEWDDLVFPKIAESTGEMYYSMPFADVRKLNNKLKNPKFINTLH
jgi:methionyl-tRNA formyltransferase